MGQVTHALLTRPPLSFLIVIPKESNQEFSLDLHVLGTPPAFVLSQDQTLNKIFLPYPQVRLKSFIKFFFDSITQILFITVFITLRKKREPLLVMLYNFQCSISLFKREFYFTTNRSNCQDFFALFIRFLATVFVTAYLIYHKLPLLSRLFLKKIQKIVIFTFILPDLPQIIHLYLKIIHLLQK